MAGCLEKIGKDFFLVKEGDKDVGTIKREGRKAAWSAYHGVGPGAVHVGNSYEKGVAIRWAAYGKDE